MTCVIDFCMNYDCNISMMFKCSESIKDRDLSPILYQVIIEYPKFHRSHIINYKCLRIIALNDILWRKHHYRKGPDEYITLAPFNYYTLVILSFFVMGIPLLVRENVFTLKRHHVECS